MREVFSGLLSSYCNLWVISQQLGGTQPHFSILYVNVEPGCALLRFLVGGAFNINLEFVSRLCN